MFPSRTSAPPSYFSPRCALKNVGSRGPPIGRRWSVPSSPGVLTVAVTDVPAPAGAAVPAAGGLAVVPPAGGLVVVAPAAGGLPVPPVAEATAAAGGAAAGLPSTIRR